MVGELLSLCDNTSYSRIILLGSTYCRVRDVPFANEDLIESIYQNHGRKYGTLGHNIYDYVLPRYRRLIW